VFQSLEAITSEQKEEYCERFESFELFEDNVAEPWYRILNATSAVAVTIAGSSMFWHKNLRTHPQVLACVWILAIGFEHMLFLSKFMVCPGNLQVLTAATLYFDAGEEAQLKAMRHLTNSFVFSARFIHAFLPLVECAFALDLVLTLRNPFANSAARTSKWLTAATLTAVVLASVVPICLRITSLKNHHEEVPRLLFFIVTVPAVIYS